MMKVIALISKMIPVENGEPTFHQEWYEHPGTDELRKLIGEEASFVRAFAPVHPGVEPAITVYGINVDMRELIQLTCEGVSVAALVRTRLNELVELRLEEKG